jgi:hypothetical protein
MENGNDWQEIIKKLQLAGFKARTAKQCRERWFNHLKPDIIKQRFTKEEENTIINAHKMYGNKWVSIAKLLPGRYSLQLIFRSDNQIKNFFYGLLRKEIRRLNNEFKALGKYKSRVEFLVMDIRIALESIIDV